MFWSRVSQREDAEKRMGAGSLLGMCFLAAKGETGETETEKGKCQGICVEGVTSLDC